MKYKIQIKNGVPQSIFAGHEIDIKTVKGVNFVGKKDCYVRIDFNDGTSISLLKEEVEMKHS